MKNIAYFLQFLIVRIGILSNFFDKIQPVTDTDCYYKGVEKTEVTCEVPEKGEYKFVPEHVFSNVTKITLNSKHITNPALITKMKPFERFFQLDDIFIGGPVKFAKELIDSEKKQENLRKQMFRVPTLLQIHLMNCNFIQLSFSKTNSFTLPANITTFKIQNCNDEYFNWQRIISLKFLLIGNANLTKLPTLGFPSVESLSLQYSTGNPLPIEALAVFCNMTDFFYPFKIYQGEENFCECKRLADWQTYLHGEGKQLRLIPDVLDKPVCDWGILHVNCSNYTLEKSKEIRRKCLSLKQPPPLPDDDAKGDSKKAAAAPSFFKKIPFWVYIIVGFLFIALVFTIFMFMGEKWISEQDDEDYEEEDFETDE